jgi:predicted phage-related endonuclease
MLGDTPMTVQHLAITGREQWLELRKPDITASTIGALFNCHPYTTPLKIYAEKRGTEFNIEDNKVMRRGRWLEPAVRKAVEEERPNWKLVEPNEYLRDPDYRIGATPDFYITGDARGKGILQAKSVAPSVYARDWNDGAEVPLWIILQAVTEAMLANADFIVVAALLVDAHNMEVAIHEMPRNPAAEEKIRKAVETFWQNIDLGIEPDPDFVRDADTIKAMWTSESEATTEVDLSGNNRIPALLEERSTLKDNIKSMSERVEAIDTEIKFEMKDAAVATGLDGWRVTYKTSHVKEYTVKARDQRVLRVTDQRGK